MSPENFAAVEPIKLHIILLTPSPEKGLVSLNLYIYMYILYTYIYPVM